MKMIYLDYAASTPISQSVLRAIKSFSEDNNFNYANPNSSHKAGNILKEHISIARNNIAKLLNAYSPSEIIFTSGATESNNLAILGPTIFSNKKTKKTIIPLGYGVRLFRNSYQNRL